MNVGLMVMNQRRVMTITKPTKHDGINTLRNMDHGSRAQGLKIVTIRSVSETIAVSTVLQQNGSGYGKRALH